MLLTLYAAIPPAGMEPESGDQSVDAQCFGEMGKQQSKETSEKSDSTTAEDNGAFTMNIDEASSIRKASIIAWMKRNPISTTGTTTTFATRLKLRAIRQPFIPT